MQLIIFYKLLIILKYLKFDHSLSMRRNCRNEIYGISKGKK